jgi:hypothetical protein
MPFGRKPTYGRADCQVGEPFSPETQAVRQGSASRIPRELPCGESLRESRMREIRMSGLTRGEGIVILQLSLPPLLYRFNHISLGG